MTTCDDDSQCADWHTGEEFFELRLYVAGQSPKCVRSIENLTIMCEEYLPGRYRIDIIDLLENPRLASADEIIAVPTLIRHLPVPVQRIIGDLSDLDQVLVALRIDRRRTAR